MAPQALKSENIEMEVVAVVVAARLRVVVLPGAVVDRHPHLLRIAVVEIVGALVVAVGVKILRIPDVRIVVEPVPVVGVVATHPALALAVAAGIGLLRVRRDVLRLDETTDAWRVVHSEGDGLSGLVIDRYGDLLVVEFFSEAISVTVWR